MGSLRLRRSRLERRIAGGSPRTTAITSGQAGDRSRQPKQTPGLPVLSATGRPGSLRIECELYGVYTVALSRRYAALTLVASAVSSSVPACQERIGLVVQCHDSSDVPSNETGHF